MPLKVPIRTYRAAIQGQEANARASVAFAPLPCPSRLRDSQQGGEPAKPGDGGQWRAGPGYPGPCRPDAHRQHRAFAAGSATMGPPRESPFCIGIYVEAEDAAAAALARLRSISFTHQMEISYSATSGTARLSIEITSGGVKSAASAKMPTIA